LVTGDTTIAIAPISKESKKKQTKYGADVVLVPLAEEDYNGVDNILDSKKEPFVIKGAGEYEVSGIFINSFAEKIARDGMDFMTNSFVFNFDGIRVCYLGQIQEALKPEHKEIIDEVDVLFVPVGGDGKSLSPYDAQKLAVGLEPKIIIPVDSDDKNLPIFLKEIGAKGGEYVEKLTVKRKDIEGKESEVVLMYEV
jgi:L-ascorbate metabolism protein UlaG (beta-lactamase superfamily)